ncbi:MAG: FHA domain-containing protein [Clostridium sp.]|nr:FHA domain-containing protein [Bacteroides sp.]MCM1198479.1 FHA domain-containing protein [Clostridium sp.]
MQEFKKCPNGHYYKGAQCPYCKTGNDMRSTSMKTEVFISPERPTVGGDDDIKETVKTDFTGTVNSGTSGGRTTVVVPGGYGPQHPKSPVANRTVFGDEDEMDNCTGTVKEPRYGRKLVGWLVTYSFDELGVDYKLFEGRNIIGRNVDCNITVNDGRVSDHHAVLLFRANKYSLTDSQSSHGTFVNGEDIDLEPRYLKDGDIIRMGNTIFKFRTSL